MKKNIIAIVVLLMCTLLMSCSTPTPVVDTNDTHTAPPAETSLPTPEPTETPTETPTPTKTPTETPEPTETPTVFGEVNNGVYVNEMLGITATFPKGWEILDKEQLIATNGGTSEIYYDFESVFGDINTVVIAQSEKPNPSNDEQSFVITLAVENTEWTPEYKDQAIESIVFAMESVDKALGSTTQIFEGEDLEMLSTIYNHIHIETVLERKTIYQEQFITGIGDLVFIITCSYTDEYQGNAGATIVNFVASIRYN